MQSWKIVYGNGDEIEKNAVYRLYETVSEYTGETLSCVNADDITEDDLGKYNLIIVGTAKSNQYLAEFEKKDYCDEGYLLKISPSKYNAENQIVVICGDDSNGTLYGCVDFASKYLANEKNTHNHLAYFKKLFSEPLTETETYSSPAVKERGLWTWGYVIYDYKGYIDNMVALKLNTLTVWNDYPPVNAKEMVEYAHSHGIKVIWGYSWLWDTDCKSIDITNLDEQIQSVINTYETQYAQISGDGIYFQSFTETDNEYNGDMIIAEVVTEWVNRISSALWAKYPELKLQFGLHATSVKNRLEYIEKLHPDITIVWEDCGAFPFHYIPKQIDDMEDTAHLTERVMAVNKNDGKFSVVLKGLTCLDWTTFTHQEGEFVLGKYSHTFVDKKAEEKRELWRYVQAYWIRNAKCAHRIIKQMKDGKDGNLLISALVEDGVFDKNIWYPVAVYADMLWSTDSSTEDIMCNAALRSDVVFA